MTSPDYDEPQLGLSFREISRFWWFQLYTQCSSERKIDQHSWNAFYFPQRKERTLREFLFSLWESLPIDWVNKGTATETLDGTGMGQQWKWNAMQTYVNFESHFELLSYWALEVTCIHPLRHSLSNYIDQGMSFRKLWQELLDKWCEEQK